LYLCAAETISRSIFCDERFPTFYGPPVLAGVNFRAEHEMGTGISEPSLCSTISEKRTTTIMKMTAPVPAAK